MTAPPPTQVADAEPQTIQLALPMVQARSADDFVNSIGINTHLGYFDTPYGGSWATVVKPKLSVLGIRHLRDAGTVLDSDGWMHTVYDRMKELSQMGLKFTLVMRPKEGTSNYATADQIDRLLTFVTPAAEAFEGLNEHDLSGRSAWVSEVRAFQQAMYAKLKADSRTRNMTVYGPAMGNPGHAVSVGDLSAWMDVGAVHPYAGGKMPMANLQDHETKLLVVNRTRPVAATEIGYHNAMTSTTNHPAVSERAMARYVPRTFLDLYNAGVTRTFLYELLDQGSNQAEREQNFGLIRRDGSEKPAFAALKNLIGVLADPGPAFSPGKIGFTLTGDTANINSLLLVKRNGRFYLVLWQEVSSYDLTAKRDIVVADRNTVLKVSPTPSQMRVFSPLSSALPIRVGTQVASLSVGVSDSPTVIEIVP